MAHSLEQLSGRLLIQCRPADAEAVLAIAKEHETGIVLTGTSPETTVRRLRDRGFDGPILCDADRYSGRKRARARWGTHPAWSRRQRELDLLPLTDSGYLPPRDLIGLRTILRAAARDPQPVVAVLPLAARWFAKPAIADALTREINAFEAPVALVLEHAKDPFGAQYLLRGFLRLLATSTVPVALLRSDVSAIGVLCHGAHAAAVGTTSALRHLYPVTARGGAARPGVSPFVTRLLGYHRLETCADLFAATPDMAHLWDCSCPVCEGAAPDWLENADAPAEAAFRHSLHCLFALKTELFRHCRTREQLLSAWHEACSHALFVHDQLAETMERWNRPANLRSWYAVTDDPLPHRTEIPSSRAEQRDRRAHRDLRDVAGPAAVLDGRCDQLPQPAQQHDRQLAGRRADPGRAQ
ncbi:hypothetical protein DV20_35955 [Amycolatopsis rifamycinica]|uniref:tRNA-guanine(15) transglycosylase-like domain-containing protein n=1 Tax=Amycolatopsis rifamycinica TaxID=287986 RepID=A0A066TUY1_9PSEU|nr:hypothetical protein DV20_35955 [Amycolatopsis rifamycinica]